MSLYQYFSSTPRASGSNLVEDASVEDLRKKVGVQCSEKELVCLSQELPKTTKLSMPQKRITYTDSDKRKISPYILQNGMANTIKKVQKVTHRIKKALFDPR